MVIDYLTPSNIFSLGIVIPYLVKNLNNWKDHVKSFYINAQRSADRNVILDYNKGKSGIYLWHNKITGKIYIGQATDLGDRKKGRLNRYYRPSYLRANSKGVSLIRAALIKYGLDNFSVAILEYCSVNDLDSREQYWINLFLAYLSKVSTRYAGPEYNILSTVTSSRGYKESPAGGHLLKMRNPRPNFFLRAPVQNIELQ
jgi:hypothetical protein